MCPHHPCEPPFPYGETAGKKRILQKTAVVAGSDKLAVMFIPPRLFGAIAAAVQRRAGPTLLRTPAAMLPFAETPERNV